jgi:uncharacterized membrane protein
MELFAHTGETMMHGTGPHNCGMMGGMMAFGLLWIMLLLVLNILGVMAITIVYRRYLSATANHTKEKKRDAK